MLEEIDIFHQPNDDCKDIQSRCFMLLLWPDNSEHQLTQELLECSDFDYVGMCHDQEGKVHHHVVLYFKNPKLLSTVANALQLDRRWIRKNDRKKSAIQYLRHINHPDKFQYPNSGFYGPLTDEAVKICSSNPNECEALEVKAFIAFLRDYPFKLSYADAITSAIDMGCYSSLRRMGNLAVKLIKEHNEGEI